MFGLDDALIGSIGSAAVGGLSSFLGTSGQNAANAKQAMQQDIYNSMMYNTALTDTRANTLQAQSYANQMLDKQNNFNMSEAQKTRDFQLGTMSEAERYNTSERLAAQGYNTSERQAQDKFNLDMASTAYQRAVKDMKAAGLNPILSAGTGGSPVSSVSPGYSSGASVSPAPGATASSGGGASGMGAQAPHPAAAAGYRAENVLGPAVQSAGNLSKLMTEISNVAQQTQNLQTSKSQIQSQTKLIDEQTNTQKQLTEKAQNDAAVSAAMINNVQSQAINNIASAKQSASATHKMEEETGILHDVGGGNIYNAGTYTQAIKRASELLGQFFHYNQGPDIRQQGGVKPYFDIQVPPGL